MTLVRVYFQAVLAARLGINNLAMLPDLRTYKQTFRVPTLNNKLGVGEKASVRKTMKSIYNVDDNFFDEIDASIKKNCKKMQDIQPYLYQFQGYTQDLMMLIGNLMKFKLRVPGFFKKAIYTMTEKDGKRYFLIKTAFLIRELLSLLWLFGSIISVLGLAVSGHQILFIR